ncbi:hypothetical protein [Oryzobacter telluris]|uniref:hypothetical protein n=1 Tax=Oryzobacter telluris TaxID=3149179 RepID=UPI00370D6647
MPSTTTDGPAVPHPAHAPLVLGLVADAAVFPPAALPLEDAVAAHRRHRTAAYAAAVGPLLVAASGVAELVRVLDAEGGRADVLDVVVVARPGGDPATLTAALEALRGDNRVRVVAAELAWEQDWRDLGLDGLPLALEVPRGEEHDLALADIRTGVREGLPVVAKFRTGPTPTWPWPDEAELADLLVALSALEVPFRLTGGLHHAARGTYEVDGVPEENHGLLNVLLATSAALSGAGREEVAAVLAVDDAEALAELVGAWSADTTSRVRAAFTGYGCCTVTDPLGELADLGLLDLT